MRLPPHLSTRLPALVLTLVALATACSNVNDNESAPAEETSASTTTIVADDAPATTTTAATTAEPLAIDGSVADCGVSNGIEVDIVDVADEGSQACVQLGLDMNSAAIWDIHWTSIEGELVIERYESRPNEGLWLWRDNSRDSFAGRDDGLVGYSCTSFVVTDCEEQSRTGDVELDVREDVLGTTPATTAPITATTQAPTTTNEEALMNLLKVGGLAFQSIGLDTTLTATVSDPDGEVSFHCVSIDWGDGEIFALPCAQPDCEQGPIGSPGAADSETYAAEHTYAVAGFYDVAFSYSQADCDFYADGGWSAEIQVEAPGFTP
jgi:hypothetical protein